MQPTSNAAVEPKVGVPPHTADTEVNGVLAELGASMACQSELTVDAKVAAATRAHQRLQAILTADRD